MNLIENNKRALAKAAAQNSGANLKKNFMNGKFILKIITLGLQYKANPEGRFGKMILFGW